MRLVVTGAIAAFAASAAIAEPVVTAPLAPNEVLLEIQAAGSVRNPASIERFTIPLSSRASTAAEARASNEALVQRATAAGRQLGVDERDIRVGRPAGLGFVGNEAYDDASESVPGQAGPAFGGFDLRVLEITLRDPSRAAALRSALERAGISNVPLPSYSLSDDRAARGVALSQALERARSDADLIARAMGMRVARVLRVSQRARETAMGWSVEAVMRQAYGLAETEDAVAETHVRIDVDFALAPQ